MHLRTLGGVVVAALGAVAAAPPAATVASPAEADPPSVRRLAGADRYATAAAVALDTFPGGADAVIARGDAFPDALSGINRAGSSYGDGRGAILLTGRGALPASTLAALRALTPHDGTVMGTPEVVSAVAERQMTALVARADRLGGVNRYSTGYRAHTNVFNLEADLPARVDGLVTAFLVSGTDPADALSAGPVAYAERVPLLLTDPSSLPAATREALRYPTALGPVQQVLVVGGPSAVSERVVAQVRALGIRTRRVAGADRQATAVEVFEVAEAEFGWSPTHVDLARGDGFADAIAAGPHAGERKAPLLFTVDPDRLGTATRELLRSRAATIRSIHVLGDSTAVSDAVVEQARVAATG